jgi:hypothetical protein
MAYSGGLPVLYPIASIYFLVTYWMDKFLLINYYREPPNFDSCMVKEIIYTFKWAFAFHLILTFCMYSNTNLLPNEKGGGPRGVYLGIVAISFAV